MTDLDAKAAILDGATLDAWEKDALEVKDPKSAAFFSKVSPEFVQEQNEKIIQLISAYRESREEISHLREALQEIARPHKYNESWAEKVGRFEKLASEALAWPAKRDAVVPEEK